MDKDEYRGYKLAKAIYKINAMIPATSADSILKAAGVDMAVTSRFQNIPNRLSKSSVRLVRLCALPDPSYIFIRKNKLPKRYIRASGSSGQIAMKEYDTGKEVYLSLGLSDSEGIPFSSGVPPVDLNPHIILNREERLELLDATLRALYAYRIDEDEMKAMDAYIYDSYRPYYELFTEFILHIPRELQEKFSQIIKSGRGDRSINGPLMKRLVYLFTQAMNQGRYFVFEDARKFLSQISQRTKASSFVAELFERFGIIKLDEGIKGPGRRPPISDRGRKLIIDAAMYLTVFLSQYLLRLRKTKMTKILKEFADRNRDFLEISDDLGESFLSRVLTEARSRRFRRICLMIRPGIEGIQVGRKPRYYFVVMRLSGGYFPSFGLTDTSIALRRILHSYFGTTSFLYEKKERKGAQINFEIYFASSALDRPLEFDRYPTGIEHVYYLIKNDYRLTNITMPSKTKLRYKEITAESLFDMISKISDAFLPKGELYNRTKEFVREYSSKILELEEERSPIGARVTIEALFFEYLAY